MIQTFGFEEALRLLKRGYRARRAVWSELDFIEFDEGFLKRHCAVGRSRIQFFTTPAVLAEDWHLVDKPSP
jgi:hypothetical protein